jgi:membrane protease YdiL (CAAX protease family)
MKERNERFPSGLEALFVIVALFAVEYVIGAAFRDASKFSGLNPRDLDGVIVLLGNGVLLVALMHYKGLTYSGLFHPSGNSLRATLATLSIPILLLVPALLMTVWALMAALVWLVPMSRWEEAMFDRMMSNGLASVVFVCVLAPVLEEMLFRGIILRSFLHQYSRWTAILGSAGLFGLFHLNIYQLVVGLILGTIAGWLYERTRSLWPCVLLHGAYNAAITMMYFVGDSTKAQDIWGFSAIFWAASFILAFVGATLLQRILVPR